MRYSVVLSHRPTTEPLLPLPLALRDPVVEALSLRNRQEGDGKNTPPLPLLSRVAAFTDIGILRKTGSWGSSGTLSCLSTPSMSCLLTSFRETDWTVTSRQRLASYPLCTLGLSPAPGQGSVLIAVQWSGAG